ncbi:MAG: hypothetical protein ACKPKO_35420, partial [Candidatus Fonsibacter sp.]
LQANQSTTYTKTEVDTELAKKANTTDMNVALALKSDKTYVDTQLALNANQQTTYTKTALDTELAKKVHQTDLEASYYTKSQTYTKLDAKQNMITTSSTLTLLTLVAQTNVKTPTRRTTNRVCTCG